MPKETLVEELVSDLSPSSVRLPATWAAVVWLALSWAWVASIAIVSEPLRPGVGGQIASSPRFALELLLGFAVGALAIAAAIRLSVPGAARLERWLPTAFYLFLGWVGLHALGLVSPTFEPSMLGKREGCYLEALWLAAGPLTFALVLLRRRFAFHRNGVALLAGLAAAALPGVLMQAACMYEPVHILTHHLGPVAGVTLATALLGRALLPRR